MERYNEYKDSGVQWLGEIPSHWDMQRWRFLLTENKVKNTDCKEKVQLQFKYGDIVRKANQDEDADVLETISKYTVVAPDDIMINGLNLNYDFISQRVAQVRENGVITSAYISLRPTSLACSRYYTYFLKSMDFKKMFHGMGTGIRLTLSYNELKNQFIPFPVIKEQQAIASYLDKATAKIDEAIAQQQKMIDLLNERKQIIINNAVTKGLNPDAPMKDSGVEWIGEICKNWRMYRLKHLLKTNLMYGANESAESEETSYPRYIRITDIDENGKLKPDTFRSLEPLKAEPYLLTRGDILFARSGATAGKTYLFDEDIKACFAGYLIKAQVSNKLLSRYLMYYTRSGIYDQWKNSIFIQATIQNIGADKYANLRIPLPTIEEQKTIVSYLDTETMKIDKVLDTHKRQISLLQERKQIIINDVVTGKVKVS
ncbi:MAG: restriction endonuclease subunit S [Bacteroidales bacterium]|nr:restriction endonuclease subunit S [Bacteroidales bacterium]